MIEGVGQISVKVLDLERATAFYRDKLGLQYLFTAGRMAFFACGRLRLLLGLSDPADEVEHGTSILYYTVQDIDAAHRQLVEAGVPCLAPPQCVHKAEGAELWLGFYADSEGNSFALMREG